MIIHHTHCEDHAQCEALFQFDVSFRSLNIMVAECAQRCYSTRDIAEKITEATGWKLIDAFDARNLIRVSGDYFGVLIPQSVGINPGFYLTQIEPVLENKRSKYYLLRDVWAWVSKQQRTPRRASKQQFWERQSRKKRLTPEECLVAHKLKAKGYKIFRHGWPDFMVVDKNGCVRMIEVKRPGEKLRKNQRELHEAFLKFLNINVETLRVNIHDKTYVP